MTASKPRADDLRHIQFPRSDEALREDVNRLGALVGEVLADQLGATFLASVEAVRTAAIRRREQGLPIDELAALLRGRESAYACALVRAFTTYFTGVNVAERVHRIRRRREHERAGDAPQPGGLRDATASLAAAGVDAAQMRGLLERLHIEPVFTAHPTEAVRRSLLDKEQALVDGLLANLDRMRTPAEWRADQERMRLALASGWQTAEAAPERPRVLDEMAHVGWFLTEVLYRIVPDFYAAFEAALAHAGLNGTALPPLLKFGTWVGGDMDGNPNVDAGTIAATLATQRRLIVAAYRTELKALSETLTQSLSEIAVESAVLERLDDYRTRLPKAAKKLKARYDDMPYRQLALLIAARLLLPPSRDGYADVAEFRADIALIDASLAQHRGEHAGRSALRRLLQRVDTFGFHLATLDLRQESAAHDAALARVLDDAAWPERDAAERRRVLAQRLADAAAAAPTHGARAKAAAASHASAAGCAPTATAALPADAPPIPTATSASDPAAPVLEVFRTVAAAQRRYGAGALGPYIVSMSHSAADVLAVLALARTAGCVDAGGAVPLDVAPLFETVADLRAAPDIVQQLFEEPVYRAHLAARGQRQIVMLGYSDSAKDGGLFAARWALQRAQVALTELARRHGVRLVFFHGRGGSISRGGGKTERAVIAAPRGSVDGWLRLTEQGEVIHRKYGIPAIALRNLEQTTGAVLRASLKPRPPEPRETRWREMTGTMADAARAAYVALVRDDAQFPAYFRSATPIDVIERLRIGSRPSRRAGAGGIERLRAIPWVFAWSQNRAGLTAWYGVGSGLEAGIARYGLAAVREMARDWAFFGTLVEDIEMVLAKSDLAIFERYSRLAGELHETFYPRIAAEFERTHRSVLALRETPDLLAGDRRLALSIRLRNPYVDPISLLQVDLLRRWRAGGSEDAELLRALVATVNGIAAGVQNTG